MQVVLQKPSLRPVSREARKEEEEVINIIFYIIVGIFIAPSFRQTLNFDHILTNAIIWE